MSLAIGVAGGVFCFWSVSCMYVFITIVHVVGVAYVPASVW